MRHQKVAIRRVFASAIISAAVIYLYLVTHKKYGQINKSKRNHISAHLFGSVEAPLMGQPHVAPVIADGPMKDVKRFTKDDSYLDRLVVVTSTNHAYVDVTENWLSSIRRTGNPHPNIHIVAEDELAYNALVKSTAGENIVHIRKAPNLSTNMTLIFDTPEYKRFCNKRPQYILDLLKSGHDVLFSDVDILWFQKPYPTFYSDSTDNDAAKKADIYVMQDQAPPRQIFCAGFVMYRSTEVTIKWVQKWIAELELRNHKRPDQEILNMMVKGNVKDVPPALLEVLNPEKYLSGQNYFNDTWRAENTHIQPIVLHNNWIVGHEAKVQRFKDLGTWYTKS